jgi:membrane-bound lytic murein transglycosylase MltF
MMITHNLKFRSQMKFICYLCLVFLISSFCFFPLTGCDTGKKQDKLEKKQEEFGHLSLDEKWKGDFDGMVEQRLIRVLVVFNKMGFFIDQGQYRGVSVELIQTFKKFINENNKDQALQIDVIFLPVYRDQLIPALVDGKGDIAVGNLTITADRLKTVDFSEPFLTDVKEIVITNGKISPLNNIEDLSGQKIHLRKSSSYYQHAIELNKTFLKKRLKPMKIIEAEEHFEDSDLLEMVDAELVPMVIVDDHKAKFWGEVFQNINLYPDIAINEGGNIGWAFRKNSPKLAEVINRFQETTKKGTKLGNIVFKKYLQENKWARNALSPDVLARYQSTIEVFKKYADQYDFDYLMTEALAFQESRLDQSRRSPAGAVGIMQLLPDTAAGKNVGIPNIENLEDNVHAGHKYLRFIQDRYFNDPEIDNLNKHLLTFAAYNAGPKKILDLQDEAKSRGLDPNVWFKNVELVVAEKIGRETVQYVSNIYKYYIAYKLTKEKAEKANDQS